MGLEIERKFLLRGNGWQKLATGQTAIRQAYLAASAKSSIRVRIKGDGTAALTVKSRPLAISRLELEYAVPVLEAEALMQLRHGAVIEKVRHEVPWGDLVWEIDVFSGQNAGLEIAEIELHHEHQHFELPDWIGAEVTGVPKYYNSSLVEHPFCSWSRHDSTQSTGSLERLA